MGLVVTNGFTVTMWFTTLTLTQNIIKFGFHLFGVLLYFNVKSADNVSFTTHVLYSGKHAGKWVPTLIS